jgi:hypothetical protein
MKLRTLVLLIPTALIVSATSKGYCCCPARPAISKEAIQYRSSYWNVDYRFSVALPPGVIGFGSARPDPNHGFFAFTSDSAQSCLSIDAFYVNPDNSQIRHQFIKKHRLPSGSQGIDKLATARTLSTSQENCNGREETRAREIITAIANDGIADGFPIEEVEYQIVLDASQSEYATGRVLLKRVVASFRRQRKVEDLSGRKRP